MVTVKREANFVKITENCQILLANKKKLHFSQKFKMQTYLFGCLSKRSLINLYYNVLFVDPANSGSRVMVKTALKSRYNQLLRYFIIKHKRMLCVHRKRSLEVSYCNVVNRKSILLPHYSYVLTGTLCAGM